jgi:hypothetical protein
MLTTIRKIAFVGLVLSLTALSLTAQTRRRPYSGTDLQVRTLINRLANRTATFRSSLDQWVSSGQIGTRAEDNASVLATSLEDSINRLRDNFAANRSTGADAQDVLDRAARIDSFLTRRGPDARTAREWANLRTDLNSLGSYYGVSWRAYQNTYPNQNSGNTYPNNGNTYPNNGNTYPRQDRGYYPGQNQGLASRLTGTYQLDVANSDNPTDAAQRAVRNLPFRDRQQVLDSLTRRLEAPDRIAIERQGRTINIASSRAPQITITADGREQVETMPSGASITARATLNGDQLMVSTTGDRANDFTVTFDPINNGQRLTVIRRVSNDRLTTPVVVQSVYNRTSDVAQFDVYDGRRNDSTVGNTGYPNTDRPTSGEFVVPDNTQLVAVLDNDLRTETTQNNDRFTMTVRSPAQYQGAVIEGYVSDISRSGRISGRSGMTLNFDTIRLRNGQTARFAGVVDNVRTASGESVRVDNEGTVQDKDSRGNTTAQRAAIGTAVGAIIGAIAGGGKGAAIGAVVGAGAGAGSVYVQGRDELDLQRGSEVTVRASAPYGQR